MDQPASTPATGRVLPMLFALFVGSGCAALIYEVVWFQLLQLTIGSSAVSTAVLLGTFMGGLCLGSLLLPRVVSPRWHPLAVYAALEFGIAACGLFVLYAAPVLGAAYDSLTPAGYLGLCGRGIVAAVCLLPPTLMMGATLPAAARWVEMTPAGASWLGLFYGGNTIGAVAGCLLAGFYLLRFFDVATATWAAIGLNVIVGIAGLLLARTTPYSPPAALAARFASSPPPRGVLLTIGLSGFTALAAEVIWTRLLSLQLGATVYTFSMILAVFLAGIGIGSVWASSIWSAPPAQGRQNPRIVLGCCQFALAAAIAWAAVQISGSLPFWPVNPSLASSPGFTFQLDLVRCLWAVLPAACLWGASFSLAIRAATEDSAGAETDGRDPAQFVGQVAAANTLGAIGGALVAGLLVWWIGSQAAQRILMALAATAGVVLLLPLLHRRWLVAVAVGGVGCALWLVPPISRVTVAYGRHSCLFAGQSEIFYVAEGLQTAVAVSRAASGAVNYHNAGKVQASSEPQDMRLQRLLGHLTTLVPDNPRRVLVIGFGAGVTAGAVSVDPHVTEETIVEIEPLVPRATATHFSEHNEAVATNPKVRIRIDDARHFLLTTRETFDAITSDPLDPWVKGAATLYTREFFDTVKKRLTKGGVFTLFVQLYETTEEAVKSELATFFAAFPHGLIFGNTHNGRGYDLVLVGQAEPTVLDLDAMQKKLARPEMAAVARSLREVGIDSAVDLCATFAGRASDMQEWLRGASINRDQSLRLQYLAGLGINRYASATIYSNLLRGQESLPEDVFRGSKRTMAALEYKLLQARKSAVPSGSRPLP